jgi:predicted restriction endonuclease
VEKVYLTYSVDLKAPIPKPASELEEKKARKKLKADISRRQGSGKFRQNVLDAFARKCAITGCDAEDALEAAHIRTYKGSDDNSLYNGILLRADIHTLFDLGYICVRTATNRVAVSKKLAGAVYEIFHDKPVRMPPFADKGRAWKKSLDHHRRLFV